ncbi:MAG: lipid kinase, partial [Hoeflea sp.]
MIKTLKTKALALATATALSATLLVGMTPDATAQEKSEFKVCWSIYVGWMPWGYLESSGIMDK